MSTIWKTSIGLQDFLRKSNLPPVSFNLKAPTFYITFALRNGPWLRVCTIKLYPIKICQKAATVFPGPTQFWLILSDSAYTTLTMRFSFTYWEMGIKGLTLILSPLRNYLTIFAMMGTFTASNLSQFVIKIHQMGKVREHLHKQVRICVVWPLNTKGRKPAWTSRFLGLPWLCNGSKGSLGSGLFS